MKRNFIMLMTMMFCLSVFAQSIISGKKYTSEEIDLIKDYTLMYEVKIKERELSIITNTDLELGYFIAILKDKNSNFIDALGLSYLNEDLSFVDNDSICITTEFLDSDLPMHGFLYVNSNSDSIMVYDATVMIMSVITTDNYILYTTDKRDHDVWKVSLDSGETMYYNGFFPCAPLYPLDEEPCIAIIEVLSTIGKYNEYIRYNPPLQYVITEDDIIRADKEYSLIKNVTIANFRVQ